MTIFDILHIPTPDYAITFHNGQFYAYKDVLIDLHSEKLIELKPLTQNNTLFNQLNIPPKSLPSAMWFDPNQIKKHKLLHSFITYLKIDFNDNISVKYFHTIKYIQPIDKNIIFFNLIHEQNNTQIYLNEYCDIQII